MLLKFFPRINLGKASVVSLSLTTFTVPLPPFHVRRTPGAADRGDDGDGDDGGGEGEGDVDQVHDQDEADAEQRERRGRRVKKK